MASVSSRLNKNGTTTWLVRFRVDGNGPYTESFMNSASADKFSKSVDRVGGREARAILRRNADKTGYSPTLAEFTTKYLDPASGLLTGIEPGTRTGYERITASFLPLLGDLPIDDITTSDIGRWVAWVEQQPSGRNPGQKLAAKTIRNYHALLSNIFKAAVEQNLRPDNPAYRTRLSRGTKYEGTFLSADERVTLEHFIPPHYRPFVYFLFGTGLRWGEATALTWGDLNLNSNPPTARITKAWKKSTNGSPVLKHTKTKKSTRTVALTEEIVAQLGTPQAGDKFVFPSKTGGHLWYGSFNTNVWAKAVAAANDAERCAEAGLTPLGKRPTIHDCRHTHASMLLERGVPMNVVQNQMGHEDIRTTVQTYGHVANDSHMQLAKVIADAMTTELPSNVPMREITP